MRSDESTGGGIERTLADMRALVLGGTGLIGSHVVLSLLRRGAAVRVLSRSPGDAPALTGLPVEIVEGRIEEIDSVRRALDSIDLLFHCAAPYPTRHFGMRRTVRVAVESTERLIGLLREATPNELLSRRMSRSEQAAIEQAQMAARVVRDQPERRAEIERRLRDPKLLRLAEQGLLDAARHPALEECGGLAGLKRIIYTSSATTIGRPRGEEQGRPPGGPAREEDRYDLAPDPSPYFACKRMMEAAFSRAANEGLPATIVNPTLVVDARDAHGTTARLLVPTARGKLPFYVAGRLNAVAGTDVGEGHVLAALRGRTGRRYILGNESMTVRRFLEIVAEEAGVRPPRLRVPLAVAEPLSLATEAVAALSGTRWALLPAHGLRMSRFTPEVDSSLAIRELGFPQSSVREAIRRALGWYREAGVL